MADIPKVVFVVVGWNNKDLLDDCFGSVTNQTYKNCSIVYVDNMSSDGSAGYVKKNYPQIAVLAQERNYGFAKGNNIGIKKALTDLNTQYVALLNTDARIRKDWVETLVAFAEKKPLAATLQSVTLDYYDRKVIDSTNIYIARNSQATQASYRKSYLGPGHIHSTKVFGVNAAAAMITRKFLDHQPYEKLFDESLFMYLEDVDVAARATVMGWDNYLVAGTEAYHMGSASSGKKPNYSFKMTFRNNGLVLVKNMPWLILIKILPRLIRSDIETIKSVRAQGNKKLVRIVIYGRLKSLLLVPLFIFKRLKMTGQRKIDRDYLWQLMDKQYNENLSI